MQESEQIVTPACERQLAYAIITLNQVCGPSACSAVSLHISRKDAHSAGACTHCAQVETHIRLIFKGIASLVMLESSGEGARQIKRAQQGNNVIAYTTQSL